MAYDGGYGGQRQYPGPGPAAPRPAPRGGHRGPPPQQHHYGAPQQQYDDYNNGYGYEDYDYNAGYGQEYPDQYQDPGYARGRPPPQQHHPQDYYGPPPGRGGRPPPGGRGDPYARGRGRGGMGPGPGPGPGPGRGGRPPLHTQHTDPGAGRRPTMNEPPLSPRGGSGYGGDPYGRRSDMDQQMADQMAGMDINGRGQRMPPSRASADSHPHSVEYGHPPMNGNRGPPQGQHQGYYEPNQGPGPRSDPGGYEGYDDGYGRGPQQRPSHEFGPPGRSRTMPLQDTGSGRDMPPPPLPQQHMNQMPYENPAGQGMPQRTYSSDPQGGPYGGYGNDYQQPGRSSYDNAYDQYYDDGRGSYQGHAPHQREQSQSSLPDFDMIQTNGRGSFEQTMRPGIEQPQPGAHQTAKLNHAKSQPDLRQPQAAVFEMAGDIPSVPPVPQIAQNPAAQNQGYGGPGGNYNRMPTRGPSAPPGPMNVPGPSPMGPAAASADAASHPATNKNADSLPSHPTPVRAGLMANSMVNMNDKPPPVRNYGGVAGPPPSQSAPPQRQAMPPVPAPGAQPKHAEVPVTPQELEHLRSVIKKNPNDQESALRLAKRLIEAADVLIPNIPDPKARGRARERYVMDAHKILKKLANAQKPDAMFLMADSLGRGLFGGGDADTKEAFTLYQSAAKIGHAAAAYRTAVCCEIGHEEGGGTRKDPMKAIQWYKRAASLGDTPAMYKVGMILLKGLLGQPRNPREAVGWLKRAAERADVDNPHSLHELGLLYESAQPNDAIIRDEKYAFNLFQQAAELGYKFSQFRLGSAYEYGLLGCPVDPRMSIMWYSKAAQREEHQSELALSGWYLTGSDGVLKQSDQEAYLWARKAAIAGLAKAEYAMGYFTETGIGVPANLEDAKRWYWRAAAQDYPKARERLEDLKRGRNNGGAPRQRERISRSQIDKRNEGECSVM